MSASIESMVKFLSLVIHPTYISCHAFFLHHIFLPSREHWPLYPCLFFVGIFFPEWRMMKWIWWKCSRLWGAHGKWGVEWGFGEWSILANGSGTTWKAGNWCENINEETNILFFFHWIVKNWSRLKEWNVTQVRQLFHWAYQKGWTTSFFLLDSIVSWCPIKCVLQIPVVSHLFRFEFQQNNKSQNVISNTKKQQNLNICKINNQWYFPFFWNCQLLWCCHQLSQVLLHCSCKWETCNISITPHQMSDWKLEWLRSQYLVLAPVQQCNRYNGWTMNLNLTTKNSLINQQMIYQCQLESY